MFWFISEYTCFARNFYGKVASSAILQVVSVEGSTSRSLMPDTRPGANAPLGEKCVPVCFSTGIIGKLERVLQTIVCNMYLNHYVSAQRQRSQK